MFSSKYRTVVAVRSANKITRKKNLERSRRRSSTIEPLESRILLSTFQVTSLADDGGTGELRWAVEQANTTSGPNTIDFKSGLTGTITLTNGEMEISTGNVTITGPGAPQLAISGNNASSIFLIEPGVTASISGLTIIDGSNTPDSGGGIASAATLTVSNCIFSNNFTVYSGGGILNVGALTVSNTIFSNNSYGSGKGVSYLGGGAIDNDNGTFDLINDSFSNNHGTSAGDYGGAIFNYNGTSHVNTVTGCMFSGNSSGTGGAIFNFGKSIAIVNSTFFGNSASIDGGAISNGDTITVINSTLSGNSAPKGGGFANHAGTVNAAFYNTIVIGNTLSDLTTANDIYGTLDTGLATGQAPSSNNLIGTGGSGGLVNGVNGNLVGVAVTAAKLGPLANNGGPTQTIALLTGSPAIDAGSNALAVDTGGNPLTTDQRGAGFARIFNGTVDIGAYEFQAAASHLVFHVQPANVIAGVKIAPSVMVYIENSSNQIVITDNSKVTLAISTGGGTLGGTVTVSAISGIATFSNLIITSAGLHQLKAADGADITAISTGFTVAPAAANKLVFSVQPSAAVAGINLNPPLKISVEDIYGNVVGTNNSQVALTINTGPGAILGTAIVNASAGIATFNAINFHVAGTYKLAAADTGLTSAVSASFIVKPAAVAHLAFVQNPINVVAGVNIAPGMTVKATDAFGNIVAGAAVKLAISTGLVGGALFGAVTATTSATGIATFSTVSLRLAGSYTLIASDGTIVSSKSTSFTVAHSAVAHLVFVQNPTNVIAGVNIAPGITVKATDAFGNVVAGAAIKLAISSGPVGGALFGTITATTAATGIATFSAVSLRLAGSYTLTASDGAIVTPKSTAFTVSAAKAAKLVFTTLPAGATHGVAFTVKVSVEDAFGNILIADSTGTITLALATHPTGSTLAGALTANVVKGIATFSNLSVNLAGSYSFKATNSFALAAVTSSLLIVT